MGRKRRRNWWRKKKKAVRNLLAAPGKAARAKSGRQQAESAKLAEGTKAAIEAVPTIDYSAIEKQMAERPVYETPKEIEEYIELTKEKGAEIQDIAIAGAEKVRTEAEAGAGRMRELAGQYSDIYRTRAGRTSMPGSGIMEDRARSTTGAYLQALEKFGASPSSIGAAFRQEQTAMQDIALRNAQYRDAAERDYAQALMGEAGMEQQAAGLLTGAETAATGMQTSAIQAGTGMIGSGLKTGAQYADQAYQLNVLDPYSQRMNLETMKLSNQFAQDMAKYKYTVEEALSAESLEAQKQMAEEQNMGVVQRIGETIGSWL